MIDPGARESGIERYVISYSRCGEGIKLSQVAIKQAIIEWTW